MALNPYIRAFEGERDLARFMQLNQQTFWESIPSEDNPDRKAFEKHYQWLLQHYTPHDSKRCRLSIAASDQDDYLGHCWLGVQNDFFTNAPIAWIFDISVRPEYRRKGIGKELLADCFAFCKRSGFASVGLQVMTQNRNALDFYHTLGFHERSFALHKKL